MLGAVEMTNEEVKVLKELKCKIEHMPNVFIDGEVEVLASAIDVLEEQIREENKSCMTCMGQVKGIYCIGCIRAEEKYLGDNYEPLERGEQYDT